MQDGRKIVWNISYVSVAFFPSLKQNFIAYRSSKVSDCIFEIHQQWKSSFSRVYLNSCCSCSFEAEIKKIGPSSHKMDSNNIVNFQESTTILNAHTKKVWKLIVCTSYLSIYLSMRVYVFTKKFLARPRKEIANSITVLGGTNGLAVIVLVNRLGLNLEGGCLSFASRQCSLERLESVKS